MYGAGLSPALPLHAADRRTSPLAALIERYCPDDGHRETQVPGLDLFRASDAGSPVCGVYRPVLAVIAQGCKRIGLGDPIRLTGDVGADMDRIRRYYAEVAPTAHRPDDFGPIRLKDEPAVN